MFSIFKKKTSLEKLQDRHAKLLQEAFVLSKSNRSASDVKMVEAQKVEQQIDDLQRNA
ncbi:MAG: Lacal_2735 family protein [Crocinitomicaceae bacterium]|nr:Lacal_2735 family protein [Crocinitomicaceae bacterium]